jgi:hypothetical protein
MLSLLLPGGAGSQQAKPGSISGHVLACNNGVIPGAQVKLAGQAAEKLVQAVTDDLGRFRMTGLRSGIYALEISAPGFETLKRAGIEVVAGSDLTLDVTLQLRTAGSAAMVVRDLPTVWRTVDAVAFLRIQESLGARPLRTEGQCVTVAVGHRASVLEVFRRYRGEPRESPVTFLQLSAGAWRGSDATVTGAETPLKPGEELVAFLTWNDSERVFQGSILLPVRDGQVRSLHIEELQQGMRLTALLEKLRAMME